MYQRGIKKFEIYQNDKLAPLTVVEADFWKVYYVKKSIEFYYNDFVVAVFNFDNIAGFKQIRD